MIGKKKSVLGDTECKTTDNLSKKCIFPFEYAGKIYNECIPRRGKYYCATETKLLAPQQRSIVHVLAYYYVVGFTTSYPLPPPPPPLRRIRGSR